MVSTVYSRWMPLLFVVVIFAACGEDEKTHEPLDESAVNHEGDGEEGGGKADDEAGEFAPLLHQSDPIGKWFREKSGINGEGIVETHYKDIVLGLAEQEGCDVSTVNTYLISDRLVRDEPFPRTVTVLCSGDTKKVANIFLSAPEASEEGGIDPRVLEMFAWNASERRYVFYRMDPVEGSDSRVLLDVEPAECRGCHLGPEGLDGTGMRMAPVMNELTLPWPHWNSEPDAENHSFELSDAVRETQSFYEVVDPWLGSAPNLELVIRSGFDRVNNARLRERRSRPPAVEDAMAMLRPVFCTERVNYVTEDGGNLLASVYVDEGIANAYRKIGDGAWPWDWFSSGRVRFGAPEGDEIELKMIPVRGAIDVAYEQRLMAVKGLSPQQVIRVKALDWKNPVFSDFRCGLWESALERVRIQPPYFDEGERTSSLFDVLYQEIMQVQVDDAGTLVSIDGGGAEVLAMDDADKSLNALIAFLQNDDPATCGEFGEGVCAQDLQSFGGNLESYIREKAEHEDRRLILREISHHNVCRALEIFGNSPDLSMYTCE